MRDWTTPRYTIRVDNKPLAESVMRRVSGVEYEDAEHMDKLTFTIDNRNRDVPLSLVPKGALIEFNFGYAGDMVAKPRYLIANRIKGWLTRTVTAFGVEQIFNGEPHKRSWTNKTLDEVVGQIAYESMGVEYEKIPERTDAKGSVLRYDYMQPNIPDFTYIYNLAKRIGYEAWFEDGKLFFMPRKYWAASYMEFTYQGPSGQVLEFVPEMSATGLRGKMSAAGIDLEDETHPQFEVTESGQTRRMYWLERKLFDAEEALARFKRAENGYWNMSPMKNRAEAEDLLAGDYVQAMEDQITATLKVLGEPHLKARRVVTVKNVDEYTGKYYVKSVKHSFSGGYQSEAALTRNATTDEGEKYSLQAASAIVNKSRATNASVLKEMVAKPAGKFEKQVLKARKA